MRSVLRFLAQCHAKGLIYRDVKPDNFMFLHNVSARCCNVGQGWEALGALQGQGCGSRVEANVL